MLPDRPISLMRRILWLLVVSAAAWTTPAAAEEPPATAASRFSERMDEILALEKAEIAQLEAEFAAAADEGEALRIQKRIRDRRRQTEIELLEAQAERAAALGLSEAAARIEADIQLLKDPDRASRLARPDTDRPAPGQR